jgi:hypothetical protein
MYCGDGKLCDMGCWFLKVMQQRYQRLTGMLGRTLLSATDALPALNEYVVNVYSSRGTYLLHKGFSARYTRILLPLSLDAYFILLPQILSAMIRRYCSIMKLSTASKITPCAMWV